MKKFKQSFKKNLNFIWKISKKTNFFILIWVPDLGIIGPNLGAKGPNLETRWPYLGTQRPNLGRLGENLGVGDTGTTLRDKEHKD